jgi:hypothetical protein
LEKFGDVAESAFQHAGPGRDEKIQLVHLFNIVNVVHLVLLVVQVYSFCVWYSFIGEASNEETLSGRLNTEQKHVVQLSRHAGAGRLTPPNSVAKRI